MQATAEMKEGSRATSKPKKKGGGCLAVVAVVFVLAAIGSQLPDPEPETSTATTSTATTSQIPATPKPIREATAVEMVRAVDKNEVAFEASWEGKRARITGRVQEVQADTSDGRLLLGASRWKYVQAEDLPKSSLVNVSKGETVTVLCDRVSETIGTAVARDCVLQ